MRATKIILIVGLLVMPVMSLAKTKPPTFAFLPIEKTLWRVSEDGKAEKQAFVFAESFIGGSESKVSPDGKQIAFTRVGNIWLFEPAERKCIEVSQFPDWDLEKGGAQSASLLGWTKDGKSLIISTIVGDYGPGEGEAPPTLPSLDACGSVSRQKIRLPLMDSFASVRNGMYVLNISSPTLKAISNDNGEAISMLHSDGAYSGAAQSPDGKTEAYINDPYGGKSELLVGSKPALPGIKVRRFWWITSNALAALSFNDNEKGYELRVISVPKFSVSGPYLERRK
jgi:dipeptidyl aminopeptidase/acylaminoacyl peptidase